MWGSLDYYFLSLINVYIKCCNISLFTPRKQDMVVQKQDTAMSTQTQAKPIKQKQKQKWFCAFVLGWF